MRRFSAALVALFLTIVGFVAPASAAINSASVPARAPMGGSCGSECVMPPLEVAPNFESSANELVEFGKALCVLENAKFTVPDEFVGHYQKLKTSINEALTAEGLFPAYRAPERDELASRGVAIHLPGGSTLVVRSGCGLG